MKKLAKLFLVVASGMFAFSCVTDATEDLGVNLEVSKGGAHEVTLSLESSRTQLGEKADGIYPIYWSEGDAIAINGVNSLPLTAGGSVDATFSFTKELSYPYYIVYPASAAVAIDEEVTDEPTEEPTAPVIPESVKPVYFLASQPYTVGTFAPQSAPMYAYAVEPAEGEEAVAPIQLNHLAGALRFAVKGDVTLASIVVEAEGAIAGAFSVDCATGELTALEGATNSVSVILPEGGLKLGAEATPIYVAVPAGKHGIYTVKLVTDALTDNTMIVRFNSDFHPIAAGVVKEFGEVTFTPNANNGEEGELVIVNVAQMKRLAQLAEVGQLGGVTKVSIGATIDMSGVEWTPINIFPSIVFDGGSDKGYEIQGLTAPLFNSTAATIQNLKLTGVNIVETKEPLSGSIARSFYGTMTNCEAAGSLVVNNTTFTTTASMSSYTVINFGGMVGQASGATFKDCTNKVNVTINSVASPEQTKVYVAVGGAIGGAHSKSSLDNVDNYGKVLIDNPTTANYNIAGVLGQMANFKIELPEVTSVTNCDNHGEVCTAASNICGTLTLGGIVPSMVKEMTDFSNNTNNAPIHNSGKAGNVNIGGVVGWVNYSDIKNCTNDAPIYNEGYVTSLQIGGINGDNVAAAIVNCVNTANGRLYNSAEQVGGNIYIGGISGGDNADHATSNNADPVEDAVSGCYNYADISHSGISKAVFLAGIHARTIGVNIDNCHNTGNITHTGTTLVWMDEGKEVSHSNTYVAGINGIDAKAITNCTNTGNITVGGESTLNVSGFYVMGIASHPKSDVKDCVNSGNITVNNVSGSGSLNIFGIYATNALAEGAVVDNCDNSGAITVGNKAAVSTGTGSSHTAYIGGCLGTSNNPVSNCDNTGNITVDNLTAKAGTYISGIVYKTVSQPLSSCTNSGAITYGNATTAASASSVFVAGVANYAYGHMSSCENKANGDITIRNLNMGQMYIGGIASTAYLTAIDTPANKWSANNNYGDISISGSSSNASSQYIGGIASYVAGDGATIDNVTEWYQCNNHGNITINGHAQAVNSSNKNGRLHIGGCFGNASHIFNFTECNNNGAIKAEQLRSGHNVFMAGIFGCIANNTVNKVTTFKDCVNRGAVAASAVTDSSIASQSGQSEGLFVAGIIGGYWFKKNSVEHDVNYVGLKNYGTLSIGGSYFVSGKRECMGGIIADIAGIGDLYDCHNEGDIIFEPTKGTSVKANVRIGGIVGSHYAAASDNAPTITFEYCTNKGNIAAKSFSTNTYVMLGGISGYTYNSGTPTHSFTNCGNSGTISIEGVTTSNNLRAGGLIGYSDATKFTFAGKNVNIGTVKISGCSGTQYAGGIIAQTTKKPVSNAESYATIHAIGVQNAGIITGGARADATNASNCGVGGKLILAQVEDVDASGDPILADVETVIGSSNWFEHIYGAAVTQAVAEGDGCYLLTAKPSLPQAPAAQ